MAFCLFYPMTIHGEHRRQRFEARASTRSAKSTLIINSSKLRKIAHQNSIRGNLNLPYKPLESALSRADLSTEWSAEKASHANIIIHHYCWFSHDVTKIQTKKLSILPRFYFHDALEQLKTNFRFKRVLGFVIEYA